MYVDTHVHLYDEQFDNKDEMIQRAIDAGVHKMYMPNCDSSTIADMMDITARWSNNCYPMMGLHPCYVKENYVEELSIVETQLAKKIFTAVGEIGLDYYWDLTFKPQQIEAFETQIDWALQYNIPIVIHSRESTQDCIDIVRKKQDGKLKGIFHCFGGSLEQAKQIADLGLYLGIGGVVTFKNSSIAGVIKQTSLEHMVLETDAPYLAPVPYRGKRNESSYIPLIADMIATLKGLDAATVAAITTQNAEKVFPK